MKDLKIVFMGTPDFAVTILEGLLHAGANIVGVVTAPDRPAGRGRNITQSAVKKYASENNLQIVQPTNLKDEAFLQRLASLNADLFVVVAFRMLPEVVWTMPEKGTINLHASLLPNYRGAAPINWALINGEKETGVTTFFIEREIDTGNIINQRSIPISENMTAGELHDQLADLGKQVVIDTIREISNGTAKSTSQKDMKISDNKNAPKIFKPDCEINWKESATKVHNFIRGLSPYPGAWCKVIFKGKILTCKLFNTRLSDKRVGKDNTIKGGENAFLFPCSDFFLEVNEIQIEGKKRMLYKEFSRWQLDR